MRGNCRSVGLDKPGTVCYTEAKQEETLIVKNAALRPGTQQRGSEPIEKNISVVDETGKVYEATYPKRAKGLVKKGRARFVDEQTICLACPPQKTEDMKMSDKEVMLETTQEPLEAPTQNAGTAETAEMPTVAYILQQLEAIRQDNAHIHEALESLLAMSDGESGAPGSPGNDLGPAKAAAIADVVKCRETTNQRLIDFYVRLYEDCKPQTRAPEDEIANLFTLLERNALGGLSDQEIRTLLLNALQKRVIG